MSKLLDDVEGVALLKGYAINTARAYRGWVEAYVRFHDVQHPLDLSTPHVARFLIHQARTRTASTVNQAHAALKFLYHQVLQHDLPGLDDMPWARGAKRLPEILSRGEVDRLLSAARPLHHLVMALLYGAGLRLREGTHLRVKDIDLERRRLMIREGKGRKDRVALLPGSLVPAMNDQLAAVRLLHTRDLAAGAGWVPLPRSFRNKAPAQGRRWPWQWVFPAGRLTQLPHPPRMGRPPIHATTVQRAVRRAGRSAGIPKRVHPHVLRHSFATHMLEDGLNLARLQKLMGHADIRTTMRYIHVVGDVLTDVVSPLDRLRLDDS